MIKKLKRGQYYKTCGGWVAVCIWVINPWTNMVGQGGYCIHKPESPQEEEPIWHLNDGTAHPAFSVIVFKPPVYDLGHPADLVREIPSPTPPKRKET